MQTRVWRQMRWILDIIQLKWSDVIGQIHSSMCQYLLSGIKDIPIMSHWYMTVCLRDRVDIWHSMAWIWVVIIANPQATPRTIILSYVCWRYHNQQTFHFFISCLPSKPNSITRRYESTATTDYWMPVLIETIKEPKPCHRNHLLILMDH